MDKKDLFREQRRIREESIFDPDNLTAKKIAKPVIGELIEQLVLWVEANPEEIEKVILARMRANNTQALLTVLDNLWTANGIHPVEKERGDIFFNYINKSLEELDQIIDDEYKALGKTLKASDAAMAGRGINAGIGLTDSNPAVPKYGTLFSKYYKGDPDLAKDMLLLQFGARILMLYHDESTTYPLPLVKFDPENSCLRKTGNDLVELIKMRERDFEAQRTDTGALPEFPIRDDIKERYCRIAVHALRVAFDGDTFADKGLSVHQKGLMDIYSSKKYTVEEANIVIQRLEDVRKRVIDAYKVYCPEAVSEIALTRT